MISIQGVSKSFGPRKAVIDFSLDVPAGEICGLLGHNGAGKSTMIGMMLGMVFPDAGRITLDGHDVFAHRARALRHVGAIFESPAFYDYLSGWANLEIFSAYTAPVRPDRMRQVVELVGLTDRIHDRTRGYSHGMRQRLALAQALLPAPKLLILDEPSDGLDPEGIREMRQLMQRLNREWGLTILLSSHLLGEVEQVCTHLAIVKDGRLRHTGPWGEAAGGSRWLVLRTDRDAAALAELRSAGLIDDHADDRVRLADGHDAAEVNRRLVERGFAVHTIAPMGASLETFYLEAVAERPTTREAEA